MAKDEAAEKKDPASPEAIALDAAKAQKKAKKKQLIILLAAVIGSLAIGGGGVAFYFINQKDKAPEAAAKAEAAAAAAEKAKPPVNTTVYVSLPHLTAPLIDHDRVLGYVLLDLSLEVSDSTMQAKVFTQLPALKAAFLEEVTSHPIGKADNPTVVDYDNLTKRLGDVANRELKDAHVNRVMVTQTIRM